MSTGAPTWDSLLVAALARELRERLAGARLRALHLDPWGLAVVLFLREGTLALRLHPGDTGLALSEPSEPHPLARPFPCTLEDVDAPSDDRVLRFHLRRVRGRRTEYLLAAELLTNQWNVVVAEREEEGEAALRIRHVLRERGGERPLRPGLPYVPPPPSGREGVNGSLSLERWLASLLPHPPRRRRGALLSGVAWTSALNAPALLGVAAREEGSAAEAALRKGHGSWRLLVEALDAPAEARRPVLLRLPGGEVQPYPVALPGRQAEPTPGLIEAFHAADEARGREGAALVPAGWLEAIEARAARLRRRADGLERELRAAPDPDAVRAVGDLLLARFADVPRGKPRVTLPDFEGRPVEVELDPTLPPHENAQRYYERAARAARARERLPALVESARAEAASMEALLARARSGDADAGEVRDALPAEAESTARPGAVSALPYRSYRSSGGLEIRVGRGARKNDDLTFHHSSPDDVWLHARHAAGAHVVLRWQEEANPPARDLAEAAVLAALHSRARSSGSVPVDWTRRKYVRKPRKAPPGVVVIERVQTVFVEPDPELEARLGHPPSSRAAREDET